MTDEQLTEVLGALWNAAFHEGVSDFEFAKYGTARLVAITRAKERLAALLASPSPKASPQEAEGWKLVPVEPTVAMVRAAINLEVAPDEPITDYLHTPGNSDEDRKIWEAVVPGIVSEAVFFHPRYSHREFMEAVLRQAYRAMIEAASPTSQGEGRGE